MKLNLKDSILDEKEKEEFLTKVEQFTDVFSLRDEIGTCPFIEVHLKLKDETPFFVRPYPMREEQKKVIQKEMDRLEHLGIIHKGLTNYSSPVVLVKRKNQNLYRVCSDFHILNEKLVKINHTFPLVRDCIEQLGRKKCHYLSTIDLRDAFHMLRLALSSQKYCGITPYYGSPTYHYLCMGMGMSGFMQLPCNRYFEVLVDHKVIKYMIKNKTKSPTTILKTLLLKLSEYTIDLKYQKGSEMHTSDALSRLHNFTDTPDQKDVIPLNFLQHFTPHYIEHSYSHLVENLYAHKTKTLDAMTVKRK